MVSDLIYVGTRTFLGRKDLVVSFYTQACQHQCSFCGLKTQSSKIPISSENINEQVDAIWTQYQDQLEDFQQISAGNEGSILDTRRFPDTSMKYLIHRSTELPNLQVLSLETRPEYIQERKLAEIIEVCDATVDFTIGFETQDDHLRNEVLRKNMSKKLLERKIRLLGRFGANLTSYVMLKPGPTMSEEDGIAEATATAEYLTELCSGQRVPLTIYLNPTYVAEDSDLAIEMKRVGYRPPKVQSVIQTILAMRNLHVPVYVGLWCENLANDDGVFTGREDYDKSFREALKLFNKTQDHSVLEDLPSTPKS